MTQAYRTLQITRRDGVATMLLNRPDVLNALSTDMFAELNSALTELAADRDVRVLLMSGLGRGFCAGLDLSDPLAGLHLPAPERSASLIRRMDLEVNAMMRKLYAFAKPKVVAVNGVAAGGGLGLALSGDIVVACRSASFVSTFVPKLGLIPDLGCTWVVPRLIGRSRSVGWSMLGEKLSAEKAAEWGLIWKCTEDAQLMQEAGEIAAQLASGPPSAQAALVEAVDASLGHSFSEQLDFERDSNARLSSSVDFQEGVNAFRERRPPRFGA